MANSDLKIIPESSMLKMPAASMLARKHSRAVFRLPPTRSSITLRELRTLPRRVRSCFGFHYRYSLGYTNICRVGWVKWDMLSFSFLVPFGSKQRMFTEL